MSSPDDEVASRISKKMNDASMLSKKSIARLFAGLVGPGLNAEDWTLLFEADRPATQDESNAS
jgi:hypothetical protein